jgi:hypothetical protein
MNKKLKYSIILFAFGALLFGVFQNFMMVTPTQLGYWHNVYDLKNRRFVSGVKFYKPSYCDYRILKNSDQIAYPDSVLLGKYADNAIFFRFDFSVGTIQRGAGILLLPQPALQGPIPPYYDTSLYVGLDKTSGLNAQAQSQDVYFMLHFPTMGFAGAGSPTPVNYTINNSYPNPQSATTFIQQRCYKYEAIEPDSLPVTETKK